MARDRRSKRVEPQAEVVSTPEKPTARDFALARLAEAQALARGAADDLGEAITAIMNSDDPDDDIEAALEGLGSASRATEAVEQMIGEVNLDENAPWEDGEE